MPIVPKNISEPDFQNEGELNESEPDLQNESEFNGGESDDGDFVGDFVEVSPEEYAAMGEWHPVAHHTFTVDLNSYLTTVPFHFYPNTQDANTQGVPQHTT